MKTPALRFRIPVLRVIMCCLGLSLALIMAPRGWATSVIPPDFKQLVNESDYVVHAVVSSVTSEWRETQGGRHIFTLVQLDVLEVIAGSPPQPLILQMLGGKVGDDEMTIAGAPKFAVGDEDVLFIQGNGRNISPLLTMMHGRYPIMREKTTGRKYMARSNKVPLQDTTEVALPMAEGNAQTIQQKMKSTAQALTPEQFVQRVKAAVDHSYRRTPPR